MELAFPKGGAHVSPQAKDLITRLLAKVGRARVCVCVQMCVCVCV